MKGTNIYVSLEDPKNLEIFKDTSRIYHLIELKVYLFKDLKVTMSLEDHNVHDSWLDEFIAIEDISTFI